MGRSLKPTRKKYSVGRINSGGKPTVGPSDSCLFSLTFKFADVKKALKKGDKLAIIPDSINPNTLIVLFQAKVICPFFGPKANKIIRCISKGYTYEGIVKEIKDGIVTAIFSGKFKG